MQFVAKKLDKRLLDLGATPIIERGLGDDQHPSGYVYGLFPLIFFFLMFQLNYLQFFLNEMWNFFDTDIHSSLV